MGSSALVVPFGLVFVGLFHFDWFGLATIRAQVATTILELLQVCDAIGASGSCYGSYTKWKRHLCGGTRHC